MQKQYTMAYTRTSNVVTGITSEDTSIPEPIAASGTVDFVEGSINVVGTSTSFLSEVKAGDWILDTNGVVYEVQSVASDTVLYLKTPAIATNLDIDLFVIIYSLSLMKQVTLIGVDATLTINSVDFPENLPIVLSKGRNANQGSVDYVNPIFVRTGATYVIVY